MFLYPKPEKDSNGLRLEAKGTGLKKDTNPSLAPCALNPAPESKSSLFIRVPRK